MKEKPIIKIGLVLALTIIFLPAVFAQQTPCSLEGLKSLCSQIPRTSQPYIELSDGRLMVNPYRANDAVPPFSAQQLKQGQENIEKHFVQVKKEYVAYLKELMGNDLNNRVLNNIVKRIESISLSITNSQCRSSLSGAGRYSTVDHSIELCPYSGFMPKTQMVRLIAHELSHSIDICNMQSNLYQIIGTLPTPPGSSRFQDNIFYPRLINSKYTSRSSFEAEPFLKELFPLLDLGVQSGSARLAAGALLVQDFPLKSVMNCMVENNLVASSAATPRAGPSCRGGTLSETPSDIWAAKITGRVLSSTSLAQPEEKLAVLSDTTVDLLCRPRRNKETGALIVSLPTRGLPVTGRYINDRYRDELTLLSDPQIQRAIGCRPVKVYKNCISSMDDYVRRDLTVVGAPSATEPRGRAARTIH